MNRAHLAEVILATVSLMITYQLQAVYNIP